MTLTLTIQYKTEESSEQIPRNEKFKKALNTKRAMMYVLYYDVAVCV